MIKSKEDYIKYLNQDKKMLNRRGRKPKINDEIWKYEILLRKCEYYKNCRKDFIGRALYCINAYRKHKLGVKCNFSIPLNVFDEGLSIAHVGTIVVNSGAKIGKNCRIHTCVNIGTSAGKEKEAPIIGNNIYIGPGAKLFGKINIADSIVIGANAVVNKSFEEKGITIGGVPAKKISDKSSENLVNI